jgi:hypothetical protein
MKPNRRNLHTLRQIQTLATYLGSQVVVEYEVRRFDDVRNLTYRRGYLITCKQRASFPGIDVSKMTASSYPDYPIMLATSTAMSSTNADDTIEIVEYTPRTVNAAITSVNNSGTSKNVSTSREHSSGSSFTQSNTYSAEASLNFFGDTLGGGLGASASTTDAYTTEQSSSAGSAQGTGTETGSSNSMSMMDWSSYASPDFLRKTVNWTWSQEFPVNAIDYQNISTGGLDGSAVGNLRDGSVLMPPSRLSLFGIDFVSISKWLYFPDPDAPFEAGPIFKSTWTLTSGSHSLESSDSLIFSTNAGKVEQLATTGALDFRALALDPILCEGPENGAVIGFVNAEPRAMANGGSCLVATAGANTLYAFTAGFTAPADSDAVLTANLSASATAQLTLRFKIADALNSYALFLKHWKDADAPVLLSISVNGNAPILRHVDSRENGSGSDNVTTIMLRNRDYSSNDFVDYLQLGLNEIVIQVAISKDAASGDAICYALRSIAIG